MLNIDDAHGAALAADLRGAAARPVDLSRAQGPARLRARGLRYGDGGLAFELREGDARRCRCAAR